MDVLAKAADLVRRMERAMTDPVRSGFVPKAKARFFIPIPVAARASARRLARRAARGPVMESQAELESLAKKLNPAIGYWDPLNLAQGEFWDQSNEATIGFLRQAEIKHGRVSMAAFVGYVLQSNGVHLPGNLANGVSYESIAAAGGPADQWDALPTAAKLQIIIFIGFLEGWSENKYALEASGQAHYMRGGKPGAFPSLKQSKSKGEWTPTAWKTTIPHPIPFEFFDPFNFQGNKSDEWKSKKLLAEINNGRLAMLGIMAFLAEAKIPGAVPF